MARSIARAAAMQLVYEDLMGGSGEGTLDALIAFTPEGDDQTYIDGICRGVKEHAQELDQLVSQYSPSREIGRIARVDLCILRVALYEMRYADETPLSVVINEAVELAKRFSEPNSARFINGVLGAVSRAEKAEPDQTEDKAETEEVPNV